ncbi:ABC transporter ATP-binding protein [Sedimenticola selenatireducens]|uniref:ABC transporter ATP-binding protein n=1 Tax=Sedimenticola selenatireducens TaxID=191960 RepID=A0A558DUR1_9GAMM|nr:ABC transporter ATP-binding protein [Sedimenticola selenatireducens]TVO72533.1 ABC transporter ATP-binding protein [Sedimenticola selenatireducens]TVT64787.1 MAG: ABC transporter ATP-binding protein [Sedimenticola selenatireducens]
MTKATQSLLEAEGLHTYYGDSHILHGIDIHIEPGETVSLMGRNGMGKTTTLRSIIGLTPARQGTITLRGKDVSKLSAHQIIRQGIAFVPEDRGIFPNLTVLENLTMAARVGPYGRDEWNLQRVLDLFPRLGERLSNMGNQLSGGEQQMLTIARGLMTNPDLIILDEATEGLAPLIRLEIWVVIRHIKATGIASIIVDKDINALLPICDRNYILNKGEVVYHGRSRELMENPELHKQFLGV